jgi:hypothetical protein
LLGLVRDEDVLGAVADTELGDKDEPELEKGWDAIKI